MEVLVTDFGSDKPPDISAYPWVDLHVGPAIHGPGAIPAQLNYGVENTEGEVIVWVPADNALNAMQYFPAILNMLDTYDIIYSDMLYIDDDGKFLGQRVVPDYKFHFCFDSYELGVSIWYRRDLHERFGMFDPDFQVHDYEWLLRCAMGGATFYHLPLPYYVYREHTKRPTGSWEPEREKVMLEQSALLSKRAKEF